MLNHPCFQWRNIIPEIQQFFSSINIEMKTTMVVKDAECQFVIAVQDHASRERNVNMKEQLLSRSVNLCDCTTMMPDECLQI